MKARGGANGRSAGQTGQISAGAPAWEVERRHRFSGQTTFFARRRQSCRQDNGPGRGRAENVGAPSMLRGWSDAQSSTPIVGGSGRGNGYVRVYPIGYAPTGSALGASKARWWGRRWSFDEVGRSCDAVVPFNVPAMLCNDHGVIGGVLAERSSGALSLRPNLKARKSRCRQNCLRAGANASLEEDSGAPLGATTFCRATTGLATGGFKDRGRSWRKPSPAGFSG